MNLIRSSAIALLSALIIPHSVAAVPQLPQIARGEVAMDIAQDSDPDSVQDSDPDSDNSSETEQFSQFEADIIREMNRARTNPNSYADWLSRQRQFFNGNTLNLPGEAPFETQEGVAALEEAIEYLRSLRPLFPLMDSEGMSQAARDLVMDQAVSGEEGHTGSDGLGFVERLAKHGTFSGGAAENLSYGRETPSTVVMMLILDDGDPNRSSRNKIFNLDFRVSGVACGDRPNSDTICTINYAGSYDDETPSFAIRPPISPLPDIGTPNPPNSEILFFENGRLADGDLVYPEDGSLYDEYSFSGRAGQKIVISLESTDFDPFLAFLNEKRDVLGQNDDASEGNQNSSLAITLPYDGLYYIFVNGYNNEDRGSYSLKIIPQSSTEEANQ
ncbi:pre-peptidase C-terminal domain-containing protein [Spirulina sp. 06S082]|uniref:pre-peptidase C-terminal domain-containing protein n=1 Tax=Spirulina sp. 06S082 TaxID=3110248 RepID=UPI002B1EA99D|nr:pre-peptidase C-terminal domain-containing protein [Spirulina sp. 06S082]MEA5471729.1 pre-peptidase C-terminal domain-containing protein [Spirulina sp. 06S082]